RGLAQSKTLARLRTRTRSPILRGFFGIFEFLFAAPVAALLDESAGAFEFLSVAQEADLAAEASAQGGVVEMHRSGRSGHVRRDSCTPQLEIVSSHHETRRNRARGAGSS